MQAKQTLLTEQTCWYGKMKWKPKSFWWKKTPHLTHGLAQVLASNLKIYAATKDITDKLTSPWCKLQWSKWPQRDESTRQLTGRASTASFSVLALTPLSISLCLKPLLSTWLQDFLNYGPGMNRFAAEMTKADSKGGTNLSALHLYLFLFAFPLFHSSICSPNLLYFTFNMLLSFQTSPASSFQHHAVYHCPDG